MVGQQRQDNRANFALLYPLGSGDLEIPEFSGQLLRAAPAGAFQQALVIPGKAVGRGGQRLLAGIQQPTDEQGVLHHDPVPEFLVSAALRAVAVLHALQLTEPGAVELRLPQDVLDEQGVIDCEEAAGADLF